jgi:hypothetical protein
MPRRITTKIAKVTKILKDDIHARIHFSKMRERTIRSMQKLPWHSVDHSIQNDYGYLIFKVRLVEAGTMLWHSPAVEPATKHLSDRCSSCRPDDPCEEQAASISLAQYDMQPEPNNLQNSMTEYTRHGTACACRMEEQEHVEEGEEYCPAASKEHKSRTISFSKVGIVVQLVKSRRQPC